MNFKHLLPNREKLQLICKLSALNFLLFLASILWWQKGVTAIVVVLLMSTLGLFWAVIAQFSKQQLQISQVLSAIANGDTSLGLPSRHSLHAKFVNVTSQLKHSQIEAQTQAHYLQTLLIHLDIAIIVVSESGDISQKNPASERLLGSLPSNVAQLSHLGECIHRAAKDEKLVISWQRGQQQDRLSVQITCVAIDGKALKLVSIQSIYLALQAKEQQAYKKLTKVLTHEIANSITPLTSLSQTAVTLVPSSLCFDDEEDKQDLQLALDTIANRTQHLDEFIARFRSLSQLPAPNLHIISLSKLVSRTLNLFEHQWQQQLVDIQFHHHSDYQLMADAAQLEQVLINLLKNATEAISLQTEKHIQLRLHQNEQAQVSLDIIDSGAGIAEHVLEMIFVPFFTTKPQGSGIGLSLSRHIMIQHGGDLAYINSTQGACFRLTFS